MGAVRLPKILVLTIDDSVSAQAAVHLISRTPPICDLVAMDTMEGVEWWCAMRPARSPRPARSLRDGAQSWGWHPRADGIVFSMEPRVEQFSR